jgi:ParB-like chromosome segregation protein Spo0J
MIEVGSEVFVDAETLIHDPNNAKKHPDKNMRAIRESLKQFGQLEPLVVRKQNKIVLGGNARLEVMKDLGYKEVKVKFIDCDDQEAKAIALVLNRTGELGEWDEDRLKVMLESIADQFNLDDLALGDDDFSFLDEKEMNVEEVEGDIPMSDEVDIDKEYLVILFDSKDAFDAVQKKLNNDHKIGYWLSKHKRNEDFYRNGPNRIFSGEKFLEVLP